MNVCLMYRSIPKPPMPPPPGQIPGYLTFLKNLVQIPRYVASLDGQMPHPFELQRRSNFPPSKHVKATVQNFSPCVRPLIELYIFCNKSATVLVVLQHTFTYEKKLIQRSRIIYVNKDDRQKIACIARRFKQSERAEKVAKLRKLALKPRGACRSFSRLCSFVTAFIFAKPQSDAGYQKKEKF